MVAAVQQEVGVVRLALEQAGVTAEDLTGLVHDLCSGKDGSQTLHHCLVRLVRLWIGILMLQLHRLGLEQGEDLLAECLAFLMDDFLSLLLLQPVRLLVG